ncbi:MAG: hypothetical protein RL497_1873 [Pseudomonadota bacterium]
MSNLAEPYLNTWFVPFLARARAHRLWPQLGFKDAAAELLLERMGLDEGAFSGEVHAQKPHITRCRWLDTQLHQWLIKHPRSLCIEWGAGLTTRFWRLSNRQDWPRCRWLEVDEPQVQNWKDTLLPRCDNRICIGCPNFNAGCPSLLRLGWQAGDALFVLLQQTNLSAEHYEQLDQLINKAGPVCLALYHPTHELPPTLKEWLKEWPQPLVFREDKGWGPFKRAGLWGWVFQRRS